MKKLMITLAAVAIAAGVQAANIDWSIGKKAFLMADGSTMPQEQKVYLVNTSASGWSTALAAIAAGEITEANIASQSFYAGDATTYKATTPGSQLHKTNYGQVNKTLADGAGVTLTDDKYAILIWDSATESPDTYFMVSQAVDGKGYVDNPEMGVQAGFTSAHFASDVSLSSGWTKVSAVPEPTSGLLLLLGMAGLALKRKRA